MEKLAFTVTYTHPEGQGTMVVYASCGEAAEAVFQLMHLPSKRVTKVEPMARQRFRESPFRLFNVSDKGVQ